MRGILSYGAYIPYNRLQRKKIKEFFGTSTFAGEKAVANFDEDTVSMSVEAAFDCLDGLDEKKVDSVYFATTSGPYVEKSSISTITKALDLQENVRGIEAAHSLRAGSSSLLSALNQNGTTLVVASDSQIGGPSGSNEQLFGDGAVSFLVGDGEDIIAKLIDSVSMQEEIVGEWRNEGDSFVHNWEERFVSTVFLSSINKLVAELLQKNNIEIANLSKAAISVPGTRGYQKVAQQLGLNKDQIQNPLFDQIGQAGSAHPGMVLVSALEEAKPGDKILLVSYAEGTDLMLFEVTDSISKLSERRGIKGYLDIKDNELPYSSYLKRKGLLETEPPRRPATDRPSAPAMYRNYDQNLGFYGSKCQACGTPQFPKQRVCAECQTKDQMEDYRFVGRTAKIATYTLDFLAPTPAPPALIAVIDFEGGGRIMCEVTDCNPKEIEIGMEVELTFRKLFEAGGIHNYFWKARPKR
ncbi:3-hydroxy-3-methylglutaryl CoA synthase [Pueribacillus theae]|uniref:3-hydroxy-3-methylglutaryl CoA synthase n=1 Tax=Pueribacillus theae TaxID=2171751 RepID=A0A2U1JW78_9BACI|nr:OB-fold domain-containing protein [Pueribacillus theae]PWA09204.1 3-hydroxy-3-methylglutaryl CoA synthase [Pueribacillus theae]